MHAVLKYSPLGQQISGSVRHELTRNMRKMDSVCIPDVRRDVILDQGGDASDEWEEHISALFEWAGLASLGSPRQVLDALPRALYHLTSLCIGSPQTIAVTRISRCMRLPSPLVLAKLLLSAGTASSPQVSSKISSKASCMCLEPRFHLPHRLLTLVVDHPTFRRPALQR